ncbi:WD40 repeat domain-containing protein [Nannocystis pusilla]|uniref:WD40 repeat domain-containing protein n=1 Tax=Nannocystis pusilla TaxID=889268 RepID=UPI003DA59C0A
MQFTAHLQSATGQMPGWTGQAAAASATHVAAIDHATAAVLIWHVDDPKRQVASLTDYSPGAQRLAVRDDALTLQRCQPANSMPAVMTIALSSGAMKLLELDTIHDIAATTDGQRLLVFYQPYPLGSLRITEFDAAGAPGESFDVQKGAGELALAPDGRTWGVTSYNRPASRAVEPTTQAQWRAFGATKWAKNLKLKGFWSRIALCDTAVVIAVGKELVVVALAKNKTLLTLQLPTIAVSVAISRDGARVGVIGDDRPRIVDVATGRIVELAPELHGEPDLHRCLCFDDEGRWLFIGHPAGPIVQHRAADGATLATLRFHTDAVRALTWAGGALWSSSEDGTIIRWGDLG